MANPDPPDADRDRRNRRVVVGLAAGTVLAAVVAVGAFFLGQGGNTAVEQRDVLASEALPLASQVQRACAEGGAPAEKLARLGACQRATSVRQAPEVVTAAPAQPAEDGADGVGIAAVVPGRCSVTVRLTDGRSTTVNDLCGREGVRGGAGRGVQVTQEDRCFVRVTYTDATPAERLGPFCGADGTDGQDGGDGTDGTDGTDGVNGQSPPCLSEPAQCRGVDGASGQPPVSWTTQRADGSVETCARADDFDPATPRYRCEVTSPPTTQPPVIDLPG